MSIVDRLQDIAKGRGTTFKQLERDIGLGNGTLRRWEEQSPRLDKLVKVADFLQVSLDYLVYGDRESATAAECDGIPLSQTEADLVAMFRYIGARERETAFDFVTMLYEKATGEKGSIYSTYTAAERGEKSDPAEGGEAQGGIA